MRGDSPEEVAARLLAVPELKGLQGPTIAPIYTKVWLTQSDRVGVCFFFFFLFECPRPVFAGELQVQV